MKLDTWNTREINKLHKQKEIKLFMKENKVDIIVLLEHKIKEQKPEKIIQKIAQGWKWETNYEHTDNTNMAIVESSGDRLCAFEQIISIYT